MVASTDVTCFQGSNTARHTLSRCHRIIQSLLAGQLLQQLKNWCGQESAGILGTLPPDLGLVFVDPAVHPGSVVYLTLPKDVWP